MSEDGCSVALSDGDTRATDVGGVRVVNLLIEDDGPVPAAFRPPTRQKYFMLYESPLTILDVSVIVESFTTTPLLNVESLATCSLYEVAFDVVFQRSVNDVAWPVALSAGETNVAVTGGVTVVKRLSDE